MANLAEGWARRGSGEFSHFVSIAMGTCSELKSHFYIALDCGYLEDHDMKDLYRLADEIARMLSSPERSLRASK